LPHLIVPIEIDDQRLIFRIQFRDKIPELRICKQILIEQADAMKPLVGQPGGVRVVVFRIIGFGAVARAEIEIPDGPSYSLLPFM
jgi:hypothetical protein